MKYIGKCGWTGKHDIDGTEIEDGDILEYPGRPEPFCVVWSDDLAGFECESSDNFMLATVWDKMKIIGNMRGNPELMGYAI